MDDLYGDIPEPSTEAPPPITTPLRLDVNITSDILETATAAIASSKAASSSIPQKITTNQQEQVPAPIIAPTNILSNPPPLKTLQKPRVISADVKPVQQQVKKTVKNAVTRSIVKQEIPVEQNSIPPSVNLLDLEVEDEYDPAAPNDFEKYKRMMARKKAEQERLQMEQQEMLEILKNVASGENEDSTDQESQSASETKEDYGTRIMKKYGWKDGQGLGKDAQGIAVPLMAKKTTGRSGIIISPDANPSRSPSPVVLLENMAEEVDAELEEEVKEECEKYGVVKRVVATTGFDDNVRIFVEFSHIKEAGNAINKLNGRFFAGKQIIARYYPLEVFNKRVYTR